MTDVVEDMDTSDGSGFAQPTEAMVPLTLALKWPDKPPNKVTMSVQRLLQTWFNKNMNDLDCSVVKALANDKVVIASPAPAVSKLLELNGQTLTKKGESVTILSVSPTTPSEMDAQPVDAAVKARPPEEEQRQTPVGAQASPGPSDAEGKIFGIVPVPCHWYVSNIFKKELEQIMEKTGTDLIAEVHVSFVKKHKGGDPGQALSDYMDLVQSKPLESSIPVAPLKFVDPDQWTEVQDMLKEKENRLLLSASSEEVLVFGPSTDREPLLKCLSAAPQTNSTAPSDTEEGEPGDTPFKVTIKDSLFAEGLSVEESYWKQISAPHDGRIRSIQAKFNVEFAATDIGQGVVRVKARHRRPVRSVSMESHAISALLRLYQKTATSLMSVSQGLLKNPAAANDCEDTVNGFVVVEQPKGAGAAAVSKKEDDNCSICLGPFIKKHTLVCKHEFCEACLQGAKDSMGPICPICRKVFGVVEGNQPKGRMTWSTSRSPLPGFPDCGQIIITYTIQSGIQTEKHPNPGQGYVGVTRVAFLPNNKEGNQVLHLLRKAFDQKLIFTIGMSRTTGMDNQVTWNDIHHKTSITGGPQCFGYPDPDYLSRVKEELKAKGIE